MDAQLKECIERLDAQNDVLGKARFDFLTKDAEKKHFEATLIQRSEGKSHAEKSVNAMATSEWREFHKDLARLESVFEFQKLKWEILDKCFLATYATFKIEEKLIRRQL